MAVTDTRFDVRRRTLEHIIRILDVGAYLVVFGTGLAALLLTPDTVRVALDNYEWLIGLWAGLLLVGGLLGLAGRLSFVWAVELPGTVAAFFGCLMYFVILGTAALDKGTAAVATLLIALAAIEMARRYVELQIFTTDRRAKTFTDRLRIVLARRTPLAVPRLH